MWTFIAHFVHNQKCFTPRNKTREVTCLTMPKQKRVKICFKFRKSDARRSSLDPSNVFSKQKHMHKSKVILKNKKYIV